MSALLDAISQMQKENSRESREAVLDLIISGVEFLAPVEILPGQGESSDLKFTLLPNQSGQPFFPAFTGWEELRKLCGPKNQQTLLLSFDDYAAMVLRDKRAAGVVVDPFGCCLSFGNHNLAWAQIQFVKIFQQQAKFGRFLLRIAEHRFRIEVYTPENPPQFTVEIFNTLQCLIDRCPNIRIKAFIIQICITDILFQLKRQSGD